MSGGIQEQNQLVTVNESNETNNANPEMSILAPEITESRRNFMDNVQVKQWVLDNVINIMDTVRSDYTGIQAEWTKINNMLSMKMENDAKYKGETQVYLPTFSKAIETRTAHVCKSSFPTDSYFDALSLKQETPEEEAYRDAVKAWMKKQLEPNAKLRSNLKPFVRNTLAFGVGFFKGWWEDSLVKQKKGRHRANSPTLDSLLAAKPSKHCGKFKVKTVNNFAFYAYPLSVDSLDQCTLQFEDIQVSAQYIETMIKKGYWKRDDITLASSTWTTEPARQETLSQNTETTQTAISGGAGGELGQYTDMSECWFSMHLPDEFFTDEEKDNGDNLEPVPMKAITCGAQLIDLQYNPFNHGKSPYLMKKLFSIPDVLITPGYGRMVMTSQYLVNDLVNQLNDNGIYALNPILIRKVGDIAEHTLSQKISPGANFDVTEKDAITFDRPPIEQIQYGLQLLSKAESQVNDPIAPPALQGSSAGGSNKTATGQQIVQSNVNIGIADFNEDMEQDILMPLCEMAQSLGQQFESAEMFLAVTGQQKIQFKPEMLAMDLSWQWVASSQTTNQQLRGQQMGLFLQSVMDPAIMQMLQAKGLQLNIEPILRKMWEDGLGQRSFGSIVSKPKIDPLTGMPVMAPGMPMPGMPPAPGAPPLSPEQITTTSQNPLSTMPAMPIAGEGEAFRSVRDGAEQASGSMGILSNLPKQ